VFSRAQRPAGSFAAFAERRALHAYAPPRALVWLFELGQELRKLAKGAPPSAVVAARFLQQVRDDCTY